MECWRLLERQSSNCSESRYGQTPSPSTGEGRGGGEAGRGSRRPSLPLPPHPNLGATASAQGRQALPPPGGKGQYLASVLGVVWAVVIATMTLTQAAWAEAIGQIKTLAGDVAIVREHVRAPAKAGDLLEQADTLMTGTDGR